jgi:hypothetical protein
LNLAHVALAFTLCFVWLRGKRLTDPAALLGAAVYAYSGYLCTQLQHFGLMVAYAWIPLGLRGIDQMAEEESIRPVWKVALAAALAFLGGYPPTWVVFSIVAGAYAWVSPGRLRGVPATVGAFVFALCLCGVEVLPAWDATHFREPEPRYGLGIKDLGFYLSYLIPNYWDFSIKTPVLTNLGKDYLYLGAPGIFGIALAWRRGVRILPAIAVLLTSLLFVVNPFNVVWNAIQHQPLLMDILRSYYFLTGVAVAFAELAAQGLDTFLTAPAKPFSAPLRNAVLAAMAAWAGLEWILWRGHSLAAGTASAAFPLVSIVLLAAGLNLLRGAFGRERTLLLIAVLAFVGVEYKTFGTSIRINAAEGDGPRFSSTEFPQLHPLAFQALQPPSDHRVLLHDLGPLPQVVRQQGWTTPQGFDPFVSKQYRDLGEMYGQWGEGRDLTLDPMRPDLMRVFGIRWVITAKQGSKFEAMNTSPRFRMIGEDRQYYQVFEYLDAQSVYGFPGKVEVTRRDPEHRVLQVDSPNGGLLTFAEQAFPGWSAKVDDKYYPLERWETAFQAVRIDSGKHTVELVYEEPFLRLGAQLSIASLLILIVWIVLSSGSTDSRASRAV